VVSVAEPPKPTKERLMVRPHKKLVHEGDYVAKVDVQLIEERTAGRRT
jgi:hypothetical protein